LEAIEQRDVEAATQAMRDHLDGTELLLRKARRKAYKISEGQGEIDSSEAEGINEKDG
jgi:hypothetical protein